MNTALEDKEYVREILNQLQGMGGYKLMSWGADGWTQFSMNNNPTLQFKVRGHHHKGHVRIELDRGRDVYNIHFGKWNRTKREWTNKETETHVYFDQMVDVIDKKVEYIPRYEDR